MARDASDEALLSIGEAAARAGLRTSALRYYEEAGLVEPAARVGGKRHYSPAVLSRLAMIALLQQSGFRLAEIRELLGRASSDTEAGAVWVEERWRAMAERKLEELDARIEQLGDARRLLEEALSCGCCELDGCELVAEAGARRSGQAVDARHTGAR